MKLPKIPKDWLEDMKKLPVVCVTWNDATSVGQWMDWEEAETKTPIEVKTVGYLLPSTKELIRLVPTIAQHGKMTDLWLIPKEWVKGVKKLK